MNLVYPGDCTDAGGKMKKMQKKQSGFTLLEIMVVVVILGILASFVAQSMFGNVDTAKIQKAVADITSLESALDRYKLDNSVYPNTDQGLEALVTKPSGSPEPRRYPADGYIKRLPKDPWGNEYQYLSPGDNGSIDIFTLGADGAEGGEGINSDIGNWNMQEFQ
jgi:general secretion pathway protein G